MNHQPFLATMLFHVEGIHWQPLPPALATFRCGVPSKGPLGARVMSSSVSLKIASETRAICGAADGEMVEMSSSGWWWNDA